VLIRATSWAQVAPLQFGDKPEKNTFRRQARKENVSATSQKRARFGDKVFTRA
jgi:hypothetical protein